MSRQQECVCEHSALIFQLPRRPMEIADQRVVSMHYTLTNAQGDVIDSSQGNEPLVYLHGGGNIIPGLEKALLGKKTGDKLAVKVEPSEGYGERNDDTIHQDIRSAPRRERVCKYV